MNDIRDLILICPRCKIPIISAVLHIDTRLDDALSEDSTQGVRDKYTAGYFRSIIQGIPRVESECPNCRGMDLPDYR